MTNGDKFRSMTDEEIAEYWAENMSCYDCPVANDICADDCAGTWLDWLRKEADE